MAVDVSRAPRGELAAAELVAAIAEHGLLVDLTERHYLELKGPENLNSRADKQKIAKFILGAANRSPEHASEAFEGYGVMIVGTTKNGAQGIDPIETLELQKVIKPFLGQAGPRWDVVRVPVEGSSKQILVILVDPPKAGQPAFICRDNGDRLTSGHVYFRDDGETRQASADEMDMLAARGAVKTAAPVDISVSVVGPAFPVVVDEVRTLEEYLAVQRQTLIDALTVPPESTTTAPFTAGVYRSVNTGSIFGSIPEDRTEGDYLASIDGWEARFRKAWPRAVRRFAGYVLDAAEVQVENRAKTFLHDVEVKLHLEGAVRAVQYAHSPRHLEDMLLKLPAPPRKWGPQQRHLGMGGLDPALFNSLPVTPRTFAPPSSTWKNSGSVDISVSVGDLRPEDTFVTDDEDSVLVIFGESPGSVPGSWRATARGHDDVFTGDFKVEVCEPRDLTEAMRHFLGLNDEEIES